MSTTGSKEADVETSATSPTDADLDRTFLGKISTDGIIAFGGSDDTFFFYPRAGFIEDESLDKKLPFNIDKDKLTKLERLAETSFHYEPEGDVYSMKVFARVNEGCARNFVDGVIYFLRKKVGDFDYGEKNRRYNGLLDKHRDIILNQFKYSVKKEIFQEFPSEPRDIAGRIKYESDIVTFGSKTKLVISPTASMRSSRLGSTLGYTRRSAAPSSAGSFAIAPSSSALAEEKRLEEQSKRAKEEEAGKKAEEHKRQQARIASILEQEKAERTAYEKKQEEIMAMAKAREDETRRNLIDAAKAIAAEETRIPETTEEHDSEAEEPTLVIDLTTSEPDEPVVITADDLPDDRSTALKVLHEALPERVKDLPTSKQKFKVQVLASKLRSMINDVRKEQKEDVLEDLPDDKVLNAREATRELGNVKKYIIERKKWNEKRVRDARAQTSANKKSYDKMHKEFVEKQKKKVKDRLEEKGKLKRQQSLAELTRLLEKSQSQPTADVPVEEPQPGPSHEYTDVTERSTAEEQPEEPVSPPAFENDEDLSEPQIVSPVTSKTRSKMVSPVTSKSRSKEADFPEGLHAKSTRSTRKVSLDTDSGAMKRLGAIMNSLTKLHKKQEAMDEWLSKRDEAHRKFRRLDRTLLEEIKANVLSLEHKVLKRDKQQELDIALAEKEIHKYLPLNNVGDEADFLFTNPVTTRCISDYIWSSLEAKGKTSPDVGAITREAMVVCFSAYLRAHMYLTRRDTKMKFDDLGWDKIMVPKTFLSFLKNLVLKRASYSHSPTNRGQDWQTVITTQLHNLRNGFYNYLGSKAKDQHEWYVLRYNDKLDFYRSYFDADREMREYQECTWAEEVAQILKANKEFPDEQCMKEVRPKYRAQFTFNNTTGDPNIHMDLLQHAANRLESLQYNIPLYISGNRGTTSIQNLQDESVLEREYQTQLQHAKDVGRIPDDDINPEEAPHSDEEVIPIPKVIPILPKTPTPGVATTGKRARKESDEESSGSSTKTQSGKKKKKSSKARSKSKSSASATSKSSASATSKSSGNNTGSEKSK